MRSSINGKLEHMLRAILAAASEEEVYAQWRAITAEDVAAAERERQRPSEVPAPGWEGRVEDRVSSARDATVTRTRSAVADSGETVDCAVFTDKGATRALGALLDSLSAHATRPLHVWLIGPAETGAPLTRRFPEITVSSIPGRPLGPSGRRLRGCSCRHSSPRSRGWSCCRCPPSSLQTSPSSPTSISAGTRSPPPAA